jgi:Zn-dependent protease
MQLNYQYMLIRIPVLLLAFPIHEFAHGFAAYKLGDSTAKEDGRLSLNPLRHLDFFGSLLILYYGFGWAKPVMVNTSRLRHPKRDFAIIAFSGPLSNFILAFVFTILLVLQLKIFGDTGKIAYWVNLFLKQFIFTNLGLGVFNMLPIPPLDGSKVFASVFPDRIYDWVTRIDFRIGMGVILLLSFTGILSRVMSPLMNAIVYAYLFIVDKLFFFL